MSNSKSASTYAVEKAYITLEILSTGDGNLRNRVVEAWVSQFLRLNPPEGEMPPEFAARYEAMLAKVTAKDEEVLGEGSLEASVRSMDELTIRQLADEMFALALDIQLLDARSS